MSGASGWVRRAVFGVAVGAGVLALAPAANAQVVGGSVGVHRPGVSFGITFGPPPVVVAPVVPVAPMYGYPVPVYRAFPAPVYGPPVYGPPVVGVPVYGGYYPRPYPNPYGYPRPGYGRPW